MNQIANALISVLGFARKIHAAIGSIPAAPMRELAADELFAVAGGDDTSGPRGGW